MNLLNPLYFRIIHDIDPMSLEAVNDNKAPISVVLRRASWFFAIVIATTIAILTI